jgi:predicted NUDIX family NTP pyrophosphohydrolase
LPYRLREGRLEVLIAHMGGPFWARRDDGAWSIVKGEHDGSEDAYAAARREFAEETGAPAPEGEALALGEVRQSGGKRVSVWAIESDFEAKQIKSNTFAIEWPRSSGKTAEFPEIDRAEWFDCATARRKLVKGQLGWRAPWAMRERVRESCERSRRAQAAEISPYSNGSISPVSDRRTQPTAAPAPLAPFTLTPSCCSA